MRAVTRDPVALVGVRLRFEHVLYFRDAEKAQFNDVLTLLQPLFFDFLEQVLPFQLDDLMEKSAGLEQHQHRFLKVGPK